MSKKKHKLARESALLAIYSFTMKADGDIGASRPKRERDYMGTPVHLPPDEYDFSEALYEKTAQNITDLDKIISDYSTNWDIERISIIDRNILRLALCEFYFFPDIPGRTTINQAVELAKNYGGEDSPRFVNGILDAVLKNTPKAT